MTSTRPFPLRVKSAAEPGPDLTSMVVVHRAILQDLRRLALTLIVVRGPLRRATRIRPGTALRYQ